MTTTIDLTDKNTRGENIRAFLDQKLDMLATKATDAETLTWWKDLLKLAGSFRRYSFNNLCLIMQQSKSASFVAGAKTWESTYGRHIQKGQKAIWIMAPMIRKSKDDAGIEKDVMVGFRYVPVFDYSQTVALPDRTDAFRDPNEVLKATGDAEKLLKTLQAFVASKGWDLSYTSISGGARGVSYGGRIEISDKLDTADRAKVLAHEIAHELLHWVDGKLDQDHAKSWREVEAESVAYAIVSAFGIEANSELYLNSWGATREIIKASTGRIFKAVKEVLTFTSDQAESQEGD